MRMSISTGAGNGMVGKLIFCGFGLFFAFMGTLFVRQEWNALQETKAMQQWAQTSCTILSSEMAENGEDYRLDVSYRYEVDGKIFTSTRYGKAPHYTAETVGEIDQIRKRLAPGKTFDCHYNPANPTEAVLDRPTLKGALPAFGFTFLFPGFGLLFAVLPWLRIRKKKTQAAPPYSPKPARPGNGVMKALGCIFLLFGLLPLKPMLITPLQKTVAAKTWNAVPATVVSSKVKSHRSDDGVTYSPYIAYRYQVGGEEYLGDQYRFSGGSSSGSAGKTAIIRQYPKGREFTVYVNPSNPAESVIQREASKHLLFGLFPLIFIGIGIALLIAAFRPVKTRLDPAQARAHVVELKSASPVGKAVGLLGFTTIWLGIVYFLATSDAPLLFPIIFGLFGLAMIGGTLHAILAIFNPRTTVEITPGNIHPGTSVAMRWRIDGRADRIGTLSIVLLCQKITTETHRSGGKTETRIVKKPIREKELLESENRGEISQGTLQFQIPEDSSPSRPGNNGGIKWMLVFQGDIARWPDLKQELPFTVYPKNKA